MIAEICNGRRMTRECEQNMVKLRQINALMVNAAATSPPLGRKPHQPRHDGSHAAAHRKIVNTTELLLTTAAKLQSPKLNGCEIRLLVPPLHTAPNRPSTNRRPYLRQTCLPHPLRHRYQPRTGSPRRSTSTTSGRASSGSAPICVRKFPSLSSCCNALAVNGWMPTNATLAPKPA